MATDRRAAAAPTWEGREPPQIALDRILDAAGRCFEATGIGATSLTDIAREAGCSRPTVYRYVRSRDELRRAYIRREAARLGVQIRSEVDTSGPPSGWLADAVEAALRGVRAEPTLSAWFTADAVGTTQALALGPDLLAELAAALLPVGGAGARAVERPRPFDDEAAAWTVRVILSLLAAPEVDAAAERRAVERFLVPVVTRPSAR